MSARDGSAFGFADNYPMFDVTPVENLFLQEFMPRAPGDYVRVYLYGLMQCYHPEGDMSLERLAGALDMDAETVLSAFRYWERQGAVERISDRPPAFRYINLKSAMLAGAGFDADVYRYRDFNARLQMLFADKKLLHPQEFEKACEWIEDLRLPEDVVLLLVKTQLDRHKGRVTFKGMEKVAVTWAEAGVRTLADAEAAIAREEREYKSAKLVLRQFSLRREPTLDELALARKWVGEWGYADDALIAACSETVKARNPSFAYLDKILEGKRGQADLPAALERDALLRDAVKAVGRALGDAAAPGDDALERYRGYLSAGFEPEAILLAAEFTARRGRHSYDELHRSLAKCAEMNLLTRDSLQAYFDGRERLRAYSAKLLAACGEDRTPTASDMAFAERFREKYAEALVLYACESARGARLPMRYAEKLLSIWAEKGANTVEEAKKEREAQPQADAARRLPGQRYDQRDYTEDEARSALVNLEDDD